MVVVRGLLHSARLDLLVSRSIRAFLDRDLAGGAGVSLSDMSAAIAARRRGRGCGFIILSIWFYKNNVFCIAQPECVAHRPANTCIEYIVEGRSFN